MGWAPQPTEEQLRGFCAKLSAWRATLSETDQQLSDSMLATALGQVEAPSAAAEEASPSKDDGQCPPVTCWMSTPWGMTHWLRHR